MKTLLEIALAEYGQQEIKGKEHNPRILQYSKESGVKNVSDDETPWCSIFVNWVAFKAGYERTNKATARSWLNIGQSIMFPEVGDIVVFKRGTEPWQGHVALFISIVGNTVYALGGNQGNRVNISGYSLSDVLGYRRLKQI